MSHHAHTERLIDTWRVSRGERRLPPRTDISPARLGPLLPQVFILGEGEDGGWRFRLAGAFVNDLHGRDLRGARFPDLWEPAARPALAAALERTRLRAQPRVLRAQALAEGGRALGLELTLAPATGPTQAADRMLGLVQPTGLVAALGGAPVRALRLLPDADPSEAPLQRPHLVVDNSRTAGRTRP